VPQFSSFHETQRTASWGPFRLGNAEGALKLREWIKSDLTVTYRHKRRVPADRRCVVWRVLSETVAIRVCPLFVWLDQVVEVARRTPEEVEAETGKSRGQ
jgi:hypothetical protein